MINAIRFVKSVTWSIGVLLMLSIASPALAVLSITNGGFESGLTGWTTANQIGSDGSFGVQTGTSSPINAFPVAAPPQGTQAAMTDAAGPGSHVLYQDFVISSSGTVTLSFSLYINNQAIDLDAPLVPLFVTPNPASLDFSTPALNQQARVDILSAGGDPFSTTVLQTLFQTNPGDPGISGYNSLSFDLTALFAAHQGETLRLRFAEVDNVGPFNFGVDDVKFASGTRVPEPTSLLLFGVGLAALRVRGKRWGMFASRRD